MNEDAAGTADKYGHAKAAKPRSRRWHQAPLASFVIDTSLGAFANAVVYMVLRLLAWLAEIFNQLFPLSEDGYAKRAAEVLEFGFAWGGAIAALAGFAVVTWYQLVKLFRSLRDPEATSQ